LQEKEDRTRKIISIKHVKNPKVLDRCKYSGCDTVWKNFKRAAWRYGENSFLGSRTVSYLPNTFASSSQKTSRFGEYIWKTYGEVDETAEALSRVIINQKLCPITYSNE
jgi:hypothetical protein